MLVLLKLGRVELFIGCGSSRVAPSMDSGYLEFGLEKA